MALNGHAGWRQLRQLLGVKQTLPLVLLRRRSGQGFNKHKIEVERRQAADCESRYRYGSFLKMPDDETIPRGNGQSMKSLESANP